jgi:hypothetical protein
MNSNEHQSSGDSSYLHSNCLLTNPITENLPVFHPEPGTSLASAIGEQILTMNSDERLQPISSTESNNDSEGQSLNEMENRKLRKTSKEKIFLLNR